ATGTAARHSEDAAADRAPEAERSTGPLEGLDGMTDWLGMAAHPRRPGPELKARVLGRALQRPPRIWSVAAAAAFLLAIGGGGGYWASRTIRGLRAERDTLAARLAALQDTLDCLTHGTAAPLAQVPGYTGGRPRAGP